MFGLALGSMALLVSGWGKIELLPLCAPLGEAASAKRKGNAHKRKQSPQIRKAAVLLKTCPRMVIWRALEGTAKE